MSKRDVLLSKALDFSADEIRMYDDLMAMPKTDVVRACISRERKLNSVLDLVCGHSVELYREALKSL